MKDFKKRVGLLLSILIIGVPLTANSFDGDQGGSAPEKLTPFVDVSDLSEENIKAPAEQGQNSPFSFSVQADVIGKSDINKGFYKKDSVEFAEVDAQLGMVFYHCPAYKEAANAALTYTATKIRWENNPYFHQEFFNTLSLSFGGFTHRVHRWMWRVQAAVNVNANEWDFKEYATYDFLLWGRYEYCKEVGIHFGFIAETGMKMDRIYPIIGADWQVSRNWKLNAVFPVNVSLEYNWNRNWSFALAGRNFNFRQRAKKDESRAVFRYQNVGAELAVKYENLSMSANVHVGTTLGGSLRIANRNNHHAHHYKFNPALYAGLESSIKF